MLDPDDRVGDVCDDREQLEAIFDEQDGANLGDGMASSDSEAERENRDREANAVVERANAALGISQVIFPLKRTINKSWLSTSKRSFIVLGITILFESSCVNPTLSMRFTQHAQRNVLPAQ